MAESDAVIPRGAVPQEVRHVDRLCVHQVALFVVVCDIKAQYECDNITSIIESEVTSSH